MSRTSTTHPGDAAAAAAARAGRGQAELAGLTPRSAREVFAGLATPEPGDMTGRWDGRIVGRWWVRWLNRAMGLPTPLRGWCGKTFAASGQVTNLVRRRGVVGPSVVCAASPGASVLDGRAALLVDYSGSGSPPVTWLHGEVRWLVPGAQVFGLLMLRPGGRTVVTFPFEMTRAEPQ